MTKKIQVGILFGGRSVEHEISLLSAKSLVEALDKDKYEPVLIGINKSGEWFLHADLDQCLLNADNAKQIQLKASEENVTVVAKQNGNSLVSLSGHALKRRIEVMFPVLHGTYGEDGTIQGLLKLANIPFVGSGVLASAVGMDKDVMKRLLKEAGIPTAKSLTLHAHSFQTVTFEDIEQALGVPFFIKPANLGSSVGVSKVSSKAEFLKKLNLVRVIFKKLYEEYNLYLI